jgi:hypothetical protein
MAFTMSAMRRSINPAREAREHKEVWDRRKRMEELNRILGIVGGVGDIVGIGRGISGIATDVGRRRMMGAQTGRLEGLMETEAMRQDYLKSVLGGLGEQALKEGAAGARTRAEREAIAETPETPFVRPGTEAAHGVIPGTRAPAAEVFRRMPRGEQFRTARGALEPDVRRGMDVAVMEQLAGLQPGAGFRGAAAGRALEPAVSPEQVATRGGMLLGRRRSLAGLPNCR